MNRWSRSWPDAPHAQKILVPPSHRIGPNRVAGFDFVADHAFGVVTLLLCDRVTIDDSEAGPGVSDRLLPQQFRWRIFPRSELHVVDRAVSIRAQKLWKVIFGRDFQSRRFRFSRLNRDLFCSAPKTWLEPFDVSVATEHRLEQDKEDHWRNDSQHSEQSLQVKASGSSDQIPRANHCQCNKRQCERREIADSRIEIDCF